MIVSFAMQKLFSLIRSHLPILAFVVIAFGVLVMKFLSMPVLNGIAYVFFYGFYGFRSYLTFKSLIYLELIFI